MPGPNNAPDPFEIEEAFNDAVPVHIPAPGYVAIGGQAQGNAAPNHPGQQAFGAFHEAAPPDIAQGYARAAEIPDEWLVDDRAAQVRRSEEVEVRHRERTEMIIIAHKIWASTAKKTIEDLIDIARKLDEFVFEQVKVNRNHRLGRNY